MSKINLLPDKLLAKTGTRKVANLLGRIAIPALSVFFVGVVAGVGYLIVLNVQLKNLNSKKSQLMTSVESLETTEQQIVLVKDRIQKVNKVLGENNTEASVESFYNSVLSFVPPGVRVTEAKVTDESTTVSFIVTSSLSLTSLFANMTSSGDFSKIRLESLSFSPSLGYLVSVEMFRNDE